MSTNEYCDLNTTNVKSGQGASPVMENTTEKAEFTK